MNHRVVLMGYFFLSFFAHLPFFFFCFLKCWACITASFSWGTSSSPSRTFPLLVVPRLLVVVRAALRDVGLVKVPQVALVVRFSVAGHGVRVEDPEARDPLAPFGHLLPTGQESPFIPWTVLLRGRNKGLPRAEFGRLVTTERKRGGDGGGLKQKLYLTVFPWTPHLTRFAS